MRKKKGPYFTYPRILPAGVPPQKDELLPQRLGGRALFLMEFGRMQGVFAPRPKLAVLEIACGSGDLSRLIVDAARARKRAIRVTAVEFTKAAVDEARAKSREYPEIDYVLHPLGSLEELSPGGHDLAVCGFALHLFGIDKAISIIKAMDCSSRGAWMVMDFRRSRWLTMLAEAVGTWSARNGRDLRQAVALTQQTFTARELKNLAFHAGIADYDYRGWFLLHQTLTRIKR
jgi:ubiquinone/menaquinone biosynthesis C-methylase UbiE